MKVKDLKKLLDGVDEEMMVLIPTSMEFDGHFVTPCEGETGEADLGIFEDEEDEKEAESLNKPITRKDFVIVPHGFFEEHKGINPELN